MGNLGGMELLVILLVALIVLGPTKLPEAARQVGKAVNELRRLSSGFQRELRDAMEVPLEADARARGDKLAAEKRTEEKPEEKAQGKPEEKAEEKAEDEPAGPVTAEADAGPTPIPPMRPLTAMGTPTGEEPEPSDSSEPTTTDGEPA